MVLENNREIKKLTSLSTSIKLQQLKSHKKNKFYNNLESKSMKNKIDFGTDPLPNQNHNFLANNLDMTFFVYYKAYDSYSN